MPMETSSKLHYVNASTVRQTEPLLNLLPWTKMNAVTHVSSCSGTNGLKKCPLLYFFSPKKVVIYNLLNILLLSATGSQLHRCWWYEYWIPSAYQETNPSWFYQFYVLDLYFTQEKSRHGSEYGCLGTLASGWSILQLLLSPCWQIAFPWKPRHSAIWDF